MIHEYNKDNDDKIPNRTPCPSCAEVLNLRSGFSINAEDERGPSPGDFILCPSCGNSFRLDDNLSPVAPTASELEELAGDPVVQAASNAIRVKSGRTTIEELGPGGVMGEAYFNQCKLMLKQVVEWKSKNKTLSPAIQYNFDKKMLVCATVVDAIDKHFVSVNEDARTMLKELGWLNPCPEMPSVLMMRVVLEKAFE